MIKCTIELFLGWEGVQEWYPLLLTLPLCIHVHWKFMRSFLRTLRRPYLFIPKLSPWYLDMVFGYDYLPLSPKSGIGSEGLVSP